MQDNSAIYDEFDKIIEQSGIDTELINEFSDKHSVAVDEINKHVDKYNEMNFIKQEMYENTLNEETEKYEEVAREYYLELKKIERHNEHALNYIDNHYDTLNNAYNIYDTKLWFMDFQASIKNDIDIVRGNLDD